MLKNISFNDIHGRKISVGDKVTFLYKSYGFRGIDNAYLLDGIYKGKGQWGFEFAYKNRFNYSSLIRIKEPQCVLYKKGGKNGN